MVMAPRRSWPAALFDNSYDPKYGESEEGNENLNRRLSQMYLVPCGVVSEEAKSELANVWGIFLALDDKRPL